MKRLCLQVINYPGSLQSAVYGLQEMFLMANKVQEGSSGGVFFDCQTIDLEDLGAEPGEADVIIIPPCNMAHDYYLKPDPLLTEFLTKRFDSGCILASACAGIFILASTGKLEEKVCTTHWALKQSFQQQYPEVSLNIDAILINEGKVITAGGMMSWIDLGFEIIAELASTAVMNRVGKMLVMDTARREQRFYQQFIPDHEHNDDLVRRVQQWLEESFQDPVSHVSLADISGVSLRTLQRRFSRVTGLSLTRYTQKLRLQRACELLENTRLPFESISYQVGYQDVSAFRKLFKREVGLLPKSFRERFVGVGSCH